MSHAPPDTKQSKTDPDIKPGEGPQAHEDLTIAEELEAMRCPDEHRPGAQCYQDDDGNRHWLNDASVELFISEEGARHSSDYQSIHGTSWQDDLFNPKDPT